MLAGTVPAEPETCVEFEAEFPDPEWEAAAEDDDLPAGRPIAEWLRSRLVAAGFPCTDVENHESFGWDFDAGRGPATVWCLLQSPGPWLLIAEPRVSLWDRIRGRSGTGGADVLRAIRALLAGDPRVKSPVWFTRSGYGARSESIARAARERMKAGRNRSGG
jgi:hypothetical protein